MIVATNRPSRLAVGAGVAFSVRCGCSVHSTGNCLFQFEGDPSAFSEILCEGLHRQEEIIGPITLIAEKFREQLESIEHDRNGLSVTVISARPRENDEAMKHFIRDWQHLSSNH
jgi:hypothetical protein